MNILGINAFHGDSSACLVIDGKLVAAAEEERFRRIKHWAGFPSESIAWCLRDAGLTLSDVDHVAINQDSSANIGKKVAYTLLKRPSLSLVLDRIKNKKERDGIDVHLARAFPDSPFKGKIHAVEHHLAHLSSAFHVSPFDEAVVVSVDGFGDFASAAWGFGRGTEITVDDRVYFPHSLGIFYETITRHLGFPKYGDEYKVMGLAPYGQPRFMREMREIVRLQENGGFSLNLDYFRHHTDKIEHEWSGGEPHLPPLFSTKLGELLGPLRSPETPLDQVHKDIARSAQAMYEEAFFHLLNTLQRQTGSTNVCIAGGCGMNSVANGKVALNTPFRNVYVQSAAGDAGGAIGAAYSVYHQLSSKRCAPMRHAYLGPEFSNDEIQSLLTESSKEIAESGCTVRRIDTERELCELAAEAISDGMVLGWFQGRMEWGPRALGNRSILGDPRRADMKDILNLKIKRRESFRPFAPSVLREEVASWFEQNGDVPFMMQVFQIREDKRALIPAVTHVDGSGRLQTVEENASRRYYRLIREFFVRTGVPMVLNTSFNENEPIVCNPQQALDCFLRTKMDVLVIGDFWLSRSNAAAKQDADSQSR